MMRTIGNHIHAGILRAVSEVIGAGSDDREKTCLIVEEIRSVDWASATFIGARHEIDLRIEGEAGVVATAADRLTALLADLEIPLSGHIVAEIAVARAYCGKADGGAAAGALTITALTIID